MESPTFRCLFSDSRFLLLRCKSLDKCAVGKPQIRSWRTRCGDNLGYFSWSRSSTTPHSPIQVLNISDHYIDRLFWENPPSDNGESGVSRQHPQICSLMPYQVHQNRGITWNHISKALSQNMTFQNPMVYHHFPWRCMLAHSQTHLETFRNLPRRLALHLSHFLLESPCLRLRSTDVVFMDSIVATPRISKTHINPT